MRDKTILALALLLALSLPGLATAAGDPLRLSAPAAGSEPDPLALCAAAPATAESGGRIRCQASRGKRERFLSSTCASRVKAMLLSPSFDTGSSFVVSKGRCRAGTHT
jgi:hypothetical protein